MTTVSPAILTRDRSNQVVKPSLSVCYKGGSASLGRSDLSDYRKNTLDSKVESVWNQLVKLFQVEGNESFRVDITDLYVTYMDPTTGKEVVRGLGQDLGTDEGKALQQEILDLSTLVKGCYRNIRGSRNIESLSNRPQGAPKAFQSFDEAYRKSDKTALERVKGIFGKVGGDLSGMSIDEFMRKHPSFVAGLDVERIRDGEKLILAFSEKLRELVKRQEPLMRKDIPMLLTLEEMIQRRNRYALYCALGIANARAQQGSLEDRLQDAKRVSDAVYEELISSMGENASELAVYSKEVGDLILHNLLEYIQRVNQDNPSLSRGFTGSSIEEFFTHAVLTGRPLNVGGAIRSLGLPFGKDAQKALEDILIASIP